MSAIWSIGLGYLIGCLSPAAWVSKKKHVDLTQEGTKNLGATNTAIVLGKKAGIFVMVFDIFKSFLSYRLARYLFPRLAIAGILACIGAILGHCFPITMGFRGGKGLAAFGGLILAYKPWMFALIVSIGILLMELLNTGVAAPIFGCFAFPLLVWLDSGDLQDVFWVSVACILIFSTHWSNLKLALEKKDVVNTRQFMSRVFGKK